MILVLGILLFNCRTTRNEYRSDGKRTQQNRKKINAHHYLLYGNDIFKTAYPRTRAGTSNKSANNA